MINSIQSLQGIAKTNNVNKTEDANGVEFNEAAQDKFEYINPSNEELTKEQKQQIAAKAKITASFWAALAGATSSAYYALRSDKTVAEKYNLDVNKDKDFIRTIKFEQVKSTIPAAMGFCFYGVGQILAGGITYLYNKNADPKRIDV